jgi:hypothetical protein
MKPHWFNRRAVCLAPLVFIMAVAVNFRTTQKLFTTCGDGLAGCGGLRGAQVRQLARPDPRPLTATAFAPPVHEDSIRADTTLKAVAARRESALKAVTTRFERRFVWAFFAGTSAMFSLACFAAAVVFARAAPRTGRLGANGRMLLALVPAVVTALALLRNPQQLLIMLHSLLRGTVAADPQLGMPAVAGVMNVLNALSLSSALALAITCCLLILPHPADDRPAPVAPAAELAQRLDTLETTATWLRIILYVQTASMVAGVLRLSATLSWIEAFLVPGDVAAFGGLRMTWTAMFGAYYSLMLAGMYLPAAYIIRERARAAIAAAPVPEATREKAYARPELSLTPGSALPRIAVMLGPVLAGPIGEFVKSLTG